MAATLRFPRLTRTPALALLCFLAAAGVVQAGPKPDSFWQVDDLRAGMHGHGLTVMKGTKVEEFKVEILGVMKNTSPGRDMVLARLSGLDLEKTGIIAGMSGSPVYIDNKLVGAVAYAWPYGKEPIAGITPFSQMAGFVEAFERRDVAQEGKPKSVGLATPVTADGKEFSTVTVAQDFDAPRPRSADEMWLVPLRTPLAATGFTPHSLQLLGEKCGKSGLVPVQGGGTTAKVAQEEKDVPLQPGGPLAVAMMTGDMDLSGIGTVTHIEGNRVYGWGHPFMGLGSCEFPLLTGYIHAIYPRQTVSFKMGSPLKTVGVINADVSTCIAGWTERKPDMLPVRMTVALGEKSAAKTFNVQIVRQRSLMSTLVFTALTNSVDMEGDLPEDMTAEFRARIEIEGQAPIIVKDTFSGFSGGRAPAALYSQVGQVVSLLTYNMHQPLKITRIECDTQILPGRRSADIESVELESDTYAPGDTVKATVFVKPYKAPRQRLPVSLKLPADLPEGTYTATVCEDQQNVRQLIRDNPNLNYPQDANQMLEAIQALLSVKRTHLVMRVPTGPNGVAVAGKALPNLPGSMVQIIGSSKRTGSQTISGSLVSHLPTEWVIQGSETVRFTVTKDGKVTKGEDR
jgi:SpoIVB peptidase S55